MNNQILIFLAHGSRLMALSWLLALGSWCPLLFSDTQSTNYKIESDFFSGGGAVQITSASYKAEENVIDALSKSLATSTNYKVDGKFGVASTPVPVINSILPGDYPRFFTDETAAFTVNAQDPDSDTMQYQLKVDGVTKVAFQSSNNLSYALAAGDRGRHDLTFQVQDTNDGTVNSVKSAYYFRRPTK